MSTRSVSPSGSADAQSANPDLAIAGPSGWGRSTEASRSVRPCSASSRATAFWTKRLRSRPRASMRRTSAAGRLTATRSVVGIVSSRGCKNYDQLSAAAMSASGRASAAHQRWRGKPLCGPGIAPTSPDWGGAPEDGAAHHRRRLGRGVSTSSSGTGRTIQARACQRATTSMPVRWRRGCSP